MATRPAPRLSRLASLGIATALVVLGCAGPLELDKEIRPSCENPAPLLGDFYPELPQYQGEYREGVGAARETARLRIKHGFPMTAFSTEHQAGFFGPLLPYQVAVLRCESSIERMRHWEPDRVDGA